VDSFLVTHLLNADDILALANYIQSTGIQISEDIDIEEVKKVRNNTTRKIIKTVVTTDPKAVEKLKLYEPYCDFFLLDSRDSGYTGGTGKENNWKMCRELIKLITKPVFIAGGLNPENVRSAIEETFAYGVDVSTGISCYSDRYLRKDRKDHSKIEEFIKIAKEYNK
jgi:phosphoribosylanthranilate isomerase